MQTFFFKVFVSFCFANYKLATTSNCKKRNETRKNMKLITNILLMKLGISS